MRYVTVLRFLFIAYPAEGKIIQREEDKMSKWNVAVSYVRSGYIQIEGNTKKEAVAAAEEKLKTMTVDEMDETMSYLPDSETVDEDDVEAITC